MQGHRVKQDQGNFCGTYFVSQLVRYVLLGGLQCCSVGAAGCGWMCLSWACCIDHAICVGQIACGMGSVQVFGMPHAFCGHWCCVCIEGGLHGVSGGIGCLHHYPCACCVEWELGLC